MRAKISFSGRTAVMTLRKTAAAGSEKKNRRSDDGQQALKRWLVSRRLFFSFSFSISHRPRTRRVSLVQIALLFDFHDSVIYVSRNENRVYR